jgi:hypothetical protein
MPQHAPRKGSMTEDDSLLVYSDGISHAQYFERFVFFGGEGGGGEFLSEKNIYCIFIITRI